MVKCFPLVFDYIISSVIKAPVIYQNTWLFNAVLYPQVLAGYFGYVMIYIGYKIIWSATILILIKVESMIAGRRWTMAVWLSPTSQGSFFGFLRYTWIVPQLPRKSSFKMAQGTWLFSIKHHSSSSRVDSCPTPPIIYPAVPQQNTSSKTAQVGWTDNLVRDWWTPPLTRH